MTTAYNCVKKRHIKINDEIGCIPFRELNYVIYTNQTCLNHILKELETILTSFDIP